MHSIPARAGRRQHPVTVLRTLTLTLTASIAALGFIAPAAPSHASPAGDSLVIDEVYAQGGSKGAPFHNKFVELFNPTDADVNVSSWSLQYRPAASTAAATAGALEGSIPAHGHYPVQLASNAENGVALPTPDATLGLNISGTDGLLVLSNQATALTLPAGTTVGNPAVVDAVGYGKATTFERAAAFALLGSTPRSLSRSADAKDTDDNSADYTVQEAVTPENSRGEMSSTGASNPTPTPTPTGPATEATIEQIQGTGAASPMVDQAVTTRGFVTADYAQGGFNGFYLQAAGTGGAIDAAQHAASDAVFVYSTALAGKVKIGDYVEVTGKVTEFYGMTEVNGNDVKELSLSGIEPVTPARIAYPKTDAEREKFEGMLVQPQGSFTVSDNYSVGQYGQFTLAAGDTPLRQPTAFAVPGSAEANQIAADNAARSVRLDDGSSVDYLKSPSTPLPWLTVDRSVRVGAKATFVKPVVLDYRNSSFAFEPTEALTPANDAPVDPVQFSNTRTDAPAAVGGSLRLATFNVENFFTTTGDQLKDCEYYKDRDGDPTTVKRGCDARGAASEAMLKRQVDKEVVAITHLGADLVSLEEIENSAQFGLNRDVSLSYLVDRLNAAEGSKVWSFVPSPAKVPGTEDVIRIAFIYRSAKVSLGGESVILDDPAFTGVARQPIAQKFVERSSGESFLVIANHFKSKGSAPATGANADPGTGVGGWNALRLQQAKALLAFSADMQREAGTNAVFMTGDYNAYDFEDPIVEIKRAGYTDEGEATGKYTYVYGGMVGSLDHVFTNEAAHRMVKGRDIWNINSVEPVVYDYGRFDQNVVNLYAPNQFRASDHDPEVIGFSPVADAAPVTPTVTLDRSTAHPGDTVTVTVGKELAGQSVAVTLHSIPVSLGVFEVPASVRFTVRIPADAVLGQHEVVVTLADGSGYGSAPLTLVATSNPSASSVNSGSGARPAAGTLPYTGAPATGRILAIAVALVVAGGAVSASRMRNRPRA